ncbi:serine/threonine-protein kinase pakD-like [Chrysoperla carnea]|uniref:serine/threonine-protein kinase pakD-like n=1 Tax=Chrysoperla carnea TaxID=189513 RepID=UPI001D07E0E0|nr:serine/threonine-protein kinase pakD-like [Chrysoperla carnea]
MNSIKFLVGFALVAIASAAPQNECNGACPRDFDPICAKDNTGNVKMFGNECMFEFEACENRAENWRQTELQECNSWLNGPYHQQQGEQSEQQQDDQSQQQEDGQSQQQQDGQSQQQQDEQSQQQTGQECRVACPLIWAPICGQDNTGNLQVFGNGCELDFTACENRAANWRAVSMNLCSSLRD